MTIDDLIALYPDRSFALFRVERGPKGKREFVWLARWNAGYFTTDSDRHVGLDDYVSSDEQYFGSTEEEAIEKLGLSDLMLAKRRVEVSERELADARVELTKVTERMERKK